MSLNSDQNLDSFLRDTETVLEQCFNDTLIIAKDTQKLKMPGDDSNDQLRVLYEHVLACARRHLEAKMYCQALKEVKRVYKKEKSDLDNAHTSDDRDERGRKLLEYQFDFEAHVRDRLAGKKVGDGRVLQHKWVKKFCHCIQLDGGDSDDDLTVMAGTEQAHLRCPIMNNDMEDPVRNHPCEHVYSKKGILALLGRKMRVGCPIAGCIEIVTSRSFKPDRQLAKEIERHRRNQANLKRKTQMDSDLSDSDSD